jgi:hypothetical protein
MFLSELFDQTEAMTFAKGEVQALRSSCWTITPG